MADSTTRRSKILPFACASAILPLLVSTASAANCPPHTVNGNTLQWQINGDTTATITFDQLNAPVSQMDIRVTTKGPVTGDTLSNEAHVISDGPGKSVAVYYYGVDTINGPVGQTKILAGGYIDANGVPVYGVGATSGVSPGEFSEGWLFFKDGGGITCLAMPNNPEPRPFGIENSHDIVVVDASVNQIPGLWQGLVAEKNALSDENAKLKAEIATLKATNSDLTTQVTGLQQNIQTISGGVFFDLSRSTKMLGKICSPILKNGDAKTARKFRRLVKRTSLANTKNVTTAQTNGNLVKKPTKSDLL